jgi:voltage-gated sodium channel
MDSESKTSLVKRCQKIAADRRFQFFILGVIVFNAVLMGLETSEPLMRAYGPLLGALNMVVQGIFVGEISLRWFAYWPRPFQFFRDGWNVFDFVVVALSLLPVAGPFAAVSRLARLLRVVRLVSVSPDLRLIVETMLRSIPSMGHVAMLLGLLLYVYAILGYYMFHRQDPVHWGTLGKALLSVFQLLTLEGWVEMQRALIPAYPWVWIYFASFVVVGVFIVINLFIAVVLNNLETVRIEQLEADPTQGDLVRRVEELRAELDTFAATLRRQREVAGDGRSGAGTRG